MFPYVEPSELDDDGLIAQVEELAALAERAETALLLTLAAFDARELWASDLSRNTTGWLARHCNLGRQHAKALVVKSRQLEAAPQVADALAAGDLSLDKAKFLARVCTPRVEEQ